MEASKIMSYTDAFLSDAAAAISGGRNAGQFVGGDEPTGTAALVQEKTSTAKETFFSKAREKYRQRQVSERGVFASQETASVGSGPFDNGSGNGNSSASLNATFGGGGNTSERQTLSAMIAAQKERRAQIVKNVIAGSSVFNVDASHHRVGWTRIAGDQQLDARQSVLTFPGIGTRSTTLAIFGGNAEPMMEHIDRQRETALLAALEASRSRTANETRQADAACLLQSFFRMAVQRRMYLRHRLTVSKQLRAIDKLRCCKAAMLLSRFCRGNMVRREYRMQRAEIAARRLDNLLRRTKVERPAMPAMLRVPPTLLVFGQCRQEEWVQDVLARYNVNFVNGMRSMLAGDYGLAINFFDAHTKTSTVSAKEQSHEVLAEVLLQQCFAKAPAAVAAELAQRNSKGKGRRGF